MLSRLNFQSNTSQTKLIEYKSETDTETDKIATVPNSISVLDAI